MGEGAWDVANDAARRGDVTLRVVDTLEGADDVLAVLAATWGEGQTIPREVIRALQASGTPPIGAFESDRMVGYVLGFLGHDDDGFHVHSHMLAVLPEWQSRGVGHALKLAQRAAALDAGVTRVRWTFDPLIARNAYFNLEKLGAVADRFHRHFYGDMGDAVNRGDRSDRLEILWDLGARWAGQRAAWEGPTNIVAHEVLGRRGPDDAPTPVGPAEVDGDAAMIRIPANYPELRRRDPALGDRWRDAVASALEACFAEGMIALRFTRDGAYLLGPRAWAAPGGAER